MNRIKRLGNTLRCYLLVPDTVERRLGYSHLYGVPMAAAIIEVRGKEDYKLATIAAAQQDTYRLLWTLKTMPQRLAYATLDIRVPWHI